MIQATVNGYSTVGTKATFAVVIEDGFDNRHERVVPLLTKSSYLAELAALKYAMMSLKDKNVSLTVKTSVKHIPPLFVKQDGKWKKKLRTNREVITLLREMSDGFKSFSCQLDLDSEKMAEVKTLARSLP